MNFIRVFLFYLIIAQFCNISNVAAEMIPDRIRVAVYSNYPFVFVNDSGIANGLYIDIIEQTAKKNNWKLEYIPTTLREALSLLNNSRIDIIPAIGYSELRDSLFYLNNELVFLNWGTVYTTRGQNIKSVIDLEGKIVGVQYADLHAVEFQQMISDFRVECRLRWYTSYNDMQRALSVGQIDAALFNRAYGERSKYLLRLESTPIILNPVEMKFAGNHSGQHLLAAIDDQIRLLKTDKTSEFQALLDQWTTPGPDFSVFRKWIYIFIVFILVILVSFLILLTVFLKSRFEEKSALLEKERASRQDIERRMEISEKEKSMILNSVSDLVLFLSPENRVLWANNHFFKTFNKRVEDVKGKAFNEIVPIDVSQFTNEPSEDGKLKTRYHEYFLPDDHRVFKATVNPVFNENEQFEGYVKTLTDVTLQKHIENELLKAKEDAEEADKLKSAFLANMSHEIRTPMNAIIGFTELLELDDSSNDEKKDYLKIIRSNGHHLMMLISDILVFSQIETGQLQIVRSAIDVKSLLNEIYSQFSEEMRRSDKMVEFKLDVEIFNSGEMFTDPIRLRQVLYNLINNAIKFTSKGSIVLGCRAGKENFMFYVKDTGTGIPKSKQQVVFKRFEQVHGSNGKKYTGTGLGLAICRELVYLMGGRIWLKSREGEGSTFYFELPG
ncbi:ATP-binding protein [Natronoflexus pectinivorans]|uniref:histidine kinase n=1 Tax=Natronoflexus pectinivorans TaxID=682526 RepID=A0A4R2GIC3_9BACT|nr:ATP-binding protein [Natronoflexus pectinivorans]TCO07643.1 PAS domain-containing protein [Natronoflexus pectinivorans]